jgi:ABC-type protease/lipase transport system fused ATPase/permease subunit
MNDKSAARDGADELRSAMFPHLGSFLSVGLFSVLVTLLMFTGPVFML